MKRIISTILLSSLSVFVFGQSITLSPTGPDELQVTTFGGASPSILGRNAGGTSSSPTATPVGNILSVFGGRGYTGTSFTNSTAAITFDASQQFTTSALGTHIRFHTTPDNSTILYERMRIAHNGNVGIGTNTPDAKLDVNGDFALSKKALLSGNGGHINFDRAGASIISVATPASGGGGETLNSIAGGVDGMVLFVYPVQGTSITLVNEDAGSVATNRIITYTASNITMTNNGGCTLIYDGTAQRWRVIAPQGGSGTAGWGLTGNSGTNPTTQFVGTTDAQALVLKTNNTEKMRIASNGNIGIGTNSPDVTLDVYGEIALSKIIRNSNSSGTINDLNTQGASVHKYSSNSNVTITGIAGGTDGKIIILIAGSSSTIVLKNFNAGSLYQNQISSNTGADITITGGSATLMYDANLQLWDVIATSL